jgi:response regulator RpfG family c-di-GMP phosphodiesterase
MNDKILFVDDEEMVLVGFRNNLRKRYTLSIAEGPEAGLRVLRNEGPFSVVVSDLKMPGMDGITFLSKVREISPESTRIILTGHAGIDSAIEAVNQGQVFRFLTKPCPLSMLQAALDAGLEQHRLITAERELLHGTLRGSIRVLTEALGLANPEAFGRAQRIKGLVNRLGKECQFNAPFELDLATMLSHLGCMGLPRDLIEKINSGLDLTQKERALFENHPRIGAMLVRNIPRLGHVADIIEFQHADFSPSLPQGARVLRLVQDYDTLANKGMTPFEVFHRLREASASYDPQLLDALEKSMLKEGGYVCRRLTMRQLFPGMILDENARTADGLLLLAKGTELDESSVLRLIEATKVFEVVEPICVLTPIS